jgi:hypothetical protein
MAVAAAAAPLLATGSSAVAGATIGSTAITFGQIASAASLVSGAFSAFSSFKQGQAAADAQEQASQQRAAELRLQMQQESTQNALEDAERQRRLRRTIASQRAAGAGFVEESGNLLNIQQQTASEAQRQQRLGQFQSDLTIGQLNRQALSEVRSGQNKAIATRNKAFTGLSDSLINIGQGANRLYKTF